MIFALVGMYVIDSKIVLSFLCLAVEIEFFLGFCTREKCVNFAQNTLQSLC